MAFSKTSWSWRGPPLVLQILLLLLGGLVVAQAATLMLTLVLPPAPAPQHGLDAIAAALRGDNPSEKRSDKLERRVQVEPPDLSGQGWLVSDRSQRDLATLLGADVGDVRLAFYTPLPFAGTVAPRRAGATVSEALPQSVPSQATRLLRPVRSARLMEGRTASPYLVLASQQLSDPGRAGFGGPRPGGIPPGGMGGVPGPAGGPGGAGPQSQSGAVPGPSGAAPGPAPDGQAGSKASGPASSPIGPASSTSSAPASSATSSTATPEVTTGAAAVSGPPSLSTVTGGSSPTVASGVALGVPRALATSPLGPATSGIGGMHGNGASPLETSSAIAVPPSVVLGKPRSSHSGGEPKAPEAVLPPVQMTPNAVELAPGGAKPLEQPRSAPQPLQAPQTAQSGAEPARPLPRGLFGLAPAPFVEGDFIAALRLPDGRWAVVEPTPEPFPNAWQRRVLLWFAVSFALTAPLGWLFARRIVKPLSGFVEAAELLGRDPSAVVVGGLDGPAEIGRAARAFNRMQTRLKAFVDDRTAMVGAISHDLRTPLTRLRFRIEDVEQDTMRDGMIGEVEEMEQMITSVLAFIRDASTPGVRERLDLRMILDDVARKVTMIGGDVRVEAAQSAPVEVDILGIRRLVTNLVENAVKYGERARICLRIDQDTAVADVADDGPGVPEDELERVFEPFYRATNAGNKKGTGLGLAVCRSIARAHGGDVRLIRSEEGGFVAQLRIPLYNAA